MICLLAGIEIGVGNAISTIVPHDETEKADCDKENINVENPKKNPSAIQSAIIKKQKCESKTPSADSVSNDDILREQ